MIANIPREGRADALRDWLEAIQQHPRLSGDSPLYLVLGAAGVGKTQALLEFLTTAKSNVYLYPAAENITLANLLRDLLRGLHMPSSSRSVAELIKEVKVALSYNDTRLFIIDQADCLPTSVYDELSEIGQTCPMVYVGRGETLLPKVQRHENVWAQTRPAFSFEPPAPKEILERILPSLHLPFWSYDPASEEDRALGEALWRMTEPSLRDLASVLEHAGESASASGLDRITLETIHAGFGRGVRDKPEASWSALMWVVAAIFLRDEYKAAHDFIEIRQVQVNGAVRPYWWWVVQAGDQLWSKFSEVKQHTVTVDEKHLKQARALLRRIASYKPGGHPPYL
jgi:hypothetical protein